MTFASLSAYMANKTCVSCKKAYPATSTHFPLRGVEGLRATCRKCFNGKRRKQAAKARVGLKPSTTSTLRTKAPTAKRYVVTYAQNATPVFEPFFASLLVYCERNDAQLLVLPGRYKNPTSIWTEKSSDHDWWDERLVPYLFEGRKTIGDTLTIYGDISTQPTAVRPLTGFEVFTGPSSGIFGHPKIQLRTVATAQREYPRILSTTGAVTVPNYTASKAGKKAEAHHVFGAVVIEHAGKTCHIRQLNATKEGSFIDLENEYSSTGVIPAPRALALVMGDIHVEQVEPAVVRATFHASDSIVNMLRPEALVFHDLLDFNRRNHHNIGSFKHRYEQTAGAKSPSVKGEILDAIRFLDEKTPHDTAAIVVASNHNDAFDRWLLEADPRQDPTNARFFHEAWGEKLDAYDITQNWVPAFELMYEKYGNRKDAVRFLQRDEDYRAGDCHLAFHGDRGLNGARSGGAATYAHLGVKTVIGHSHVPSVLDGCVQVGVSGKLDMGYNSTPSSWAHAHCVIYANGKRSLIFIARDGSWRA